MAGEEQVPMIPWWRGFKGTIKKVSEHKYDVQGVARKINDTTVEITELPIHKWTQNYKAELEAMCGEKGDGVIKVTGVTRILVRPSTDKHIGLQGALG
jgi:DNA topoisomerase II